jgi:hypothetical protein
MDGKVVAEGMKRGKLGIDARTTSCSVSFTFVVYVKTYDSIHHPILGLAASVWSVDALGI